MTSQRSSKNLLVDRSKLWKIDRSDAMYYEHAHGTPPVGSDEVAGCHVDPDSTEELHF